LRSYFASLFQTVALDGAGVQRMRMDGENGPLFKSVSDAFQMIEPSMSVAVPYGSDAGRVRAALSALAAGAPGGRRHYRQLQPHLVSLSSHEYRRLVAAGLVAEVVPGLGEWIGSYSETGIVVPVSG
jgi:hypothetical protein